MDCCCAAWHTHTREFRDFMAIMLLRLGKTTTTSENIAEGEGEKRCTAGGK